MALIPLAGEIASRAALNSAIAPKLKVTCKKSSPGFGTSQLTHLAIGKTPLSKDKN